MSIKSKVTKKTLKNIEKITGTKLTIGKVLWAIRESDDISQVEFSETLKISRQHLCDIEHGRKSVSPKLAAKYAAILRYSKEQFIRLALQELVDRDKLNVQVEVTLTKRNKKQNDSRVAA